MILTTFNGTRVVINPNAVSSMTESQTTEWTLLPNGEYGNQLIWVTRVFIIGDPPDQFFKFRGRLEETLTELLK